MDLRKTVFIGVVEDNVDPMRLGRCRCRVMNVFEDIPTSDIPWATPWKDLNGNQFTVPDIGKVVSIIFDEGNLYKPEYIYAEHYNINLQKKLLQISGSNYTSMRALIFDHKTQIYSNDADGLKIDYKFNNINITDSAININLKDNFSNVNVGAGSADQQAILGNHFLNWFDKFINILTSNSHLGNLAAPLTPTPAMLKIRNEYYALRNPKFLSEHVNIVDNNKVVSQERIADGQIGDAWKSTVTGNKLVSSESVGFTPKSGDVSIPGAVADPLTQNTGAAGAAGAGAGTTAGQTGGQTGGQTFTPSKDIYKVKSSADFAFYGGSNITKNNVPAWVPMPSSEYGKISITSGFGPRNFADIGPHMHNGIDIAGAEGKVKIITPFDGKIVAMASGFVAGNLRAGGGLGNYIIIEWDSPKAASWFCHLFSIPKEYKVGSLLKAGDPIGLMGNTGCSFGAHLHWEIRIGGAYGKAVDPIEWTRKCSPNLA